MPKKNKTLKILHVAAFAGNLGDNANHSSFYSWFVTFFPQSNLEWTRLDLRGVWRSDRDLGRRIQGAGSKFDLIVIGGGNFWEMWDSSSRNGTSLNVSYEELKAEGVPVFFNALGAEVERGVCHQAQEVFPKELELYGTEPQFFVSLRNDGSISNLGELGIDTSRLTTLPDHAFFLERDLKTKSNVRVPRVLMNLAKDMEMVRYTGTLDYSGFVKGISRVLSEVYSQTEFELLFFSQIPTDIEIGNEVFKSLPDSIIRDNGSLVYPNRGNHSQIDFLEFFNDANLVLAQRFHSNILALASNSDLIGISNHAKVIGLHQEVGTRDTNMFPIFDKERLEAFSGIFTAERVLASLDPNIPKTKFLEHKVKTQRLVASQKLQDWLTSHNLL